MAKLNKNLLQALSHDLWTIHEIDLQIARLIDTDHVVSWLRPPQKAIDFQVQFAIADKTIGQFYIDLLESIIDRLHFFISQIIELLDNIPRLKKIFCYQNHFDKNSLNSLANIVKVFYQKMLILRHNFVVYNKKHCLINCIEQSSQTNSEIDEIFKCPDCKQLEDKMKSFIDLMLQNFKKFHIKNSQVFKEIHELRKRMFNESRQNVIAMLWSALETDFLKLLKKMDDNQQELAEKKSELSKVLKEKSILEGKIAHLEQQLQNCKCI